MASSLSSFTRNGKKIVAIGRNYMEHVKELNNPTPKEPFFFLKPTTSYIQSGETVEIPKGILAHHEVELGVIISKTGKDILPADAKQYIGGYALAVDMTARNLQEQVKSRGLPWTASKGFDTFTPIGQFISASDVQDPQNLNLTLKVNGETRQDGTTADMIFRIPELIGNVSGVMTLEEGDLILTGTPSGVGPVAPGDTVECTLVDKSAGSKVLDTLKFKATERSGGYKFTS